MTSCPHAADEPSVDIVSLLKPQDIGNTNQILRERRKMSGQTKKERKDKLNLYYLVCTYTPRHKQRCPELEGLLFLTWDLFVELNLFLICALCGHLPLMNVRSLSALNLFHLHTTSQQLSTIDCLPRHDGFSNRHSTGNQMSSNSKHFFYLLDTVCDWTCG